MKTVLHALGNVLRLLGISSPEDATPEPKPKTAADPPSWRDSRDAKPEDRES